MEGGAGGERRRGGDVGETGMATTLRLTKEEETWVERGPSVAGVKEIGGKGGGLKGESAGSSGERGE